MFPARNVITTHSLRTATMGRAVVGRGFTLSTSSRHGLKESSSRTSSPSLPCPATLPPLPNYSRMNPRRRRSTETDIDLDRHKQDSLAKQKKGSGHWKPELASDSEEAVRADRAAPEDVARMQERTKRSAEETSRAGTSTRDGM